jgi:hypothetical protein
LTFPEEPRNLYRRTSVRKSASRAPESQSLRKVTLGSTLESTTFASISSPFGSTTPVARPFFVLMRATGAFVRISTPASRAAPAMARLIAPVPPREKPHERKAPSISPM